MGNPYRHPLRIGQLRQDPRTPGRVVEVLDLHRKLEGFALRVDRASVKDARDGQEKTLDADLLIHWHLMPSGSVEMPASPLEAVEAVLHGDTRCESKGRPHDPHKHRRVKVLEVEGPEPDDRALVENLDTGRQTRMKVSSLAKWTLISRREA